MRHLIGSSRVESRREKRRYASAVSTQHLRSRSEELDAGGAGALVGEERRASLRLEHAERADEELAIDLVERLLGGALALEQLVDGAHSAGERARLGVARDQRGPLLHCPPHDATLAETPLHESSMLTDTEHTTASECSVLLREVESSRTLQLQICN